MPDEHNWRPFEEARALVVAQNFKKSDEFRAWGDRPDDIPYNPKNAYKKVWDGWEYFLGTGPRLSAPPVEYLSFEEARLIVVAQNFKRGKDFENWSERPANIPENPKNTYSKDWRGWQYFNGIGPPNEILGPDDPKGFLLFDEARVLAQKLIQEFNITTPREWGLWAKTAAKPRNIPADPYAAYLGKGWNGWPYWFNTAASRASGKEVARSFMEAREFAHSLGLKSSRDWVAWANSDARPVDIPRSPLNRYQDKGWLGWSDFLGYEGRWTHNKIVKFLKSLTPCIEHLTELDLYLILMHNGLLQRDQRLRGSKVLRGLMYAKSADELKKAQAEFIHSLKPVKDTVIDQSVDDPVDLDAAASSEASNGRTFDVIEAMATVDSMVGQLNKDEGDNSALQFIIDERVEMLWKESMTVGGAAVLQRLTELPDGKYSQMIRERFEREYEAAQALQIPEHYRIVDAKEQPVKLNLMQRLTALRLLHRRRLGNWSGVGTGKTNAATFAAAVIDARMTLILAATSTIDGWKKTIARSFDVTKVYVHDEHPMDFRFRPNRMNFVIVNYQTFQLKWTDEFLNLLSEQAPLDFIIFDEVQYVRKRHKAETRTSTRRKKVNELISSAVQRNPRLHILAMSATPVVNNLTEAVKLLELIRPEEDFKDVPVVASIANAINVHILLKRHGFRFMPQYDLQLKERIEKIDGQEQLNELSQLRPRDVLRMEQTVLQTKLRHLDRWVRRGTLIYTHFVGGIVKPLAQAVEGMGLQVRRFTGEEKISIDQFLKEFHAGTADVLIGSAPVGTGVDGLQFVLDRILFITLPWSHADYEQVVGRLWRQGSTFGKIDVIIPQVTLNEGAVNEWSWDAQRLQSIKFKETLADAAVDGVIPSGGLLSPQEMQRRSLEALNKWIDRSGEGKVANT